MAERITDMSDFPDVIDSTLDFHPCATPRGMLYYQMDVLTNEQQRKLNRLKRRTVAEDEKYLAKHPQVRACVAIMIREVLKERPRTNLYEVLATYFSQPRANIESDVSNYIGTQKCAREGDSHVDLFSSPSSFLSTKIFDHDKVASPSHTISLDVTRSFRTLDTQYDSRTPLSKRDSLVQYSALLGLSAAELTDEKITEIFIRKMLEDRLDLKNPGDREKIIRIHSYPHLQEAEADETASRHSEGFETTGDGANANFIAHRVIEEREDGRDIAAMEDVLEAHRSDCLVQVQTIVEQALDEKIGTENQEQPESVPN